MEEHNICNIIKDDINILFLGEMTSGKTTLISCILNKLVGVIKRTGGTDKINIYNYGNTTDNIKISNDKYIFEKVENCDIKINNMKLNLIDTIGLNNLEHIEKQEKSGETRFVLFFVHTKRKGIEYVLTFKDKIVIITAFPLGKRTLIRYRKKRFI